jgi:hypothetical protein
VTAAPVAAVFSTMKKIYVSGPITKGDRSHNFYQAAQAQKRLMLAGYSVLNPMLSMMHPDGPVIPWEAWIASDLPWVASADMILRLPGESKGADLETAHAQALGVTVVTPEHFACLQ